MTYRMMIGFIFAFVPSFFCAIAFKEKYEDGSNAFQCFDEEIAKNFNDRDYRRYKDGNQDTDDQADSNLFDQCDTGQNFFDFV